MGTTTTTNLNLIKPDILESIKEDLPSFPGWADQNADNCDTLDALFRATTHTYAPVWDASGTNPTLGSGGFVEGKYIRMMPRMVVGFFRIYTGTTGFSAGTGLYRLTAPVAAAAELDGFNSELPVGKAAFHDASSVATSSAFTVMYSSSSQKLFMRIPVGDGWTATAPVALGQSDRIQGYFYYPTSAA